MKALVVLLFACAALLSGCGPCVFVTNEKACDAATVNAPLLPQIKVGMTTDEVRKIMRHDAERRDVAGDVETWLYMSDYEAGRMTAITFTAGRVTAIRTVPYTE